MQAVVVDTSVLLAVLLAEPESHRFKRLLTETDSVLISAATYLEACIVVSSRLGRSELRILDDLLQTCNAQIVGFTQEQAFAAREAFLEFGRGNHKARLNFGDCFSYALSKVSGQPLLYKGKDFSLTDVKRA